MLKVASILLWMVAAKHQQTHDHCFGLGQPTSAERANTESIHKHLSRLVYTQHPAYAFSKNSTLQEAPALLLEQSSRQIINYHAIARVPRRIPD
jgi:hypothetical protein